MSEKRSVTDLGLEQLARRMYELNCLSDFRDVSTISKALEKLNITMIEREGECRAIVRNGKWDLMVTLSVLERRLIDYFKVLQRPSPAIEAGEADLERRVVSPRPKDELPTDRVAASGTKNAYVPPEKMVNGLNQRSYLYLGLAAIGSILVAGVVGALSGYQVGLFSGKNRAEEKARQEAKKEYEQKLNFRTDYEEDLIFKMSRLLEEMGICYDGDARQKVQLANSERDYVESFTDLMDTGDTFVELNTALGKLGSELERRDYKLEASDIALEQLGLNYVLSEGNSADLERSLGDYSNYAVDKIKYLIEQSSVWFDAFSTMASLWLDAEGRYVNSYADALAAEQICGASWEDEKRNVLYCVNGWRSADEDAKRVAGELVEAKATLDEAKTALAQAVETNAYQAGQFDCTFIEENPKGDEPDNNCSEFESALGLEKENSSQAQAGAERCMQERRAGSAQLELERSIALIYTENGSAAEAERDGIVLELGQCLAEGEAIAEINLGLDSLYQASLVIANATLADLIRTEEDLTAAKEQLVSIRTGSEKRAADYSALESSSKQELERKQEELAQLQRQLDRVQEQLQISEGSNTSYSQEKSKNGADLAECRADEEKLQKESSRISGLLEEKTREYQSLVNSFGEERKKAQEQLTLVEKQLKTEREKNSGCSAEKDEKERDYSRCAEERDQFMAQNDEERSELETCLDERREALAEQIRIQSGLDACVEEKERWYGGSLSVRNEDGKVQICYEEGIPYETLLDDGEVLSVVGVSCVSKEEWKSNYKNLIAEAVSSPQVKETLAAIEQKLAEKLTESYVPKVSESDLPLREVSYYGQLIANPARAEEIALAYVEERGGSITVCGKNNRDKAVSLYEQIAPEGRDDVYTLEFFVKGTSEFYQGMDAKTPYCVPLTVIEE